jgi:hypothetical protein
MAITPVDDNQKIAGRISAPGVRKPAPGLENLCRGAVQEQFEDAWHSVMRNIADPNTIDDKAREINIRIVLKPYEGNRQQVTMASQVPSKLAPQSPVLSTVYLEGVNSANPHGIEVGGVE